MKKIALTALTALAIVAVAVPAEAQRRNWGGGNGPSLTLYAGVDYRLQSIVITSDVPDLASLNFDETAGSLVARGEWQVCLDANYGSRCRIYSDAIPNLESFRGRVSSVRFMGDGRGFNNGGGWNNGGGNNFNNPPRYNGQAVSGRTTVFYPGSVSGGNGRNSFTADAFCRAQGHSSVAFSDQDRNGNLADVLCRR